MVLANPAIQLGTAEAITDACRGVKTAHEIEIMRYAKTEIADT
jgi:Xaa-Pro aminopeptidase